MSERILLAGVGGIGGVIAARLLQAGHRPILLTANASITEAIRARGVQVIEGGLRQSIAAEAVTTIEELPGDARFDLALLLMKANAVVAAARQIAPRLGPAGFLVPCQNGIVEDAVAEAVGAEKVVAAIVGWGGTMHEPGVYEKTGPGAIHIGELDGRPSQRAERLAAILRAASPVVVSQNIRGVLWSKLAINCVITTLGAVTGRTLGEMLKQKNIRRIFLGVYREVIDTAEALSVRLERVAADPKLLYLPAGAGPLKAFFKDLLVRLVGRRYGRLKSSMLQSLERGRPTEIDFLNGYVVREAARANVPVPLNQALVRLVKEIEAGRRPPDPGNLNELE
jgi:2-dehydropantoate 2-reductase